MSLCGAFKDGNRLPGGLVAPEAELITWLLGFRSCRARRQARCLLGGLI
jgi:hypothetical protein